MIRDLQFTAGDICRDASGLHVRVDGVDTHNRVHFSVCDDDEENWILRGEMSSDAFSARFVRLYDFEIKAA